LTQLGFRVFAQPDKFRSRPAAAIFGGGVAAKAARPQILVRWFNQPAVRNYLRITIGTATEAEILTRAARTILS